MIMFLGIRIFVAWLLFLPVAILNGLLREKVLKRFMRDVVAHQLSTFILSCAFFATAWLALYPFAAALSYDILLAIGTAWVLLTLIFEFGFGHYVMHHAWEKLLADYDISKGRVWPLFLVVEVLAPLVLGALMR